MNNVNPKIVILAGPNGTGIKNIYIEKPEIWDRLKEEYLE